MDKLPRLSTKITTKLSQLPTILAPTWQATARAQKQQL